MEEKLKIILLLFLVACVGQVTAQARPGFKLGANSSNISKTRLDSKTGLYIGAFIKIPIADYYAMQPEVLYSNQGGASNSTEYGDVNINYLSIALPNKFYVVPNKGFHFMLGVGIDINLDNNFIGLSNFNIDEEISPIDIVAMGGIGYEFDFGLSIEARYKQGTISIDFLGADNLYEEDGSNLNGVFQIGAAYKFKIK